MSKNADVIVIGSGIIGNAAAYYLAKSGLSVTVLDKEVSVGNGGSSRNGGGVRQSGRDVRELPLAMYGIKNLWPSLSEELGTDVEYYQEGNLRLGKTPEHLEILKKLADKASGVGLDVRMVSGDEARQINPFLSEEVLGASWCPSDGHANPLTATLGFYRAARRLGVSYYTNQEVLALKKIKGRLKRVVTKTDVFECDQVVVAAGLGSRKIVNTVGIDVPLYPEKLECLVTEVQPQMFYQMLGCATADFYGHQTKHGSFVFGGSSGLDMTNRDNGLQDNSSITTSCICRGIMGYFPNLADVKVVRSWAGYIDDCIDNVPVISSVPEVPGLVLACGFTGHGFGIAPAVGKVLSEIVTGKETSADISALKYDRFRAKN